MSSSRSSGNVRSSISSSTASANLEQPGLRGERAVAPDPVDRAVARRRRSARRPGSSGSPSRGQRSAAIANASCSGLLGEIEVAEEADQGGDDAAPLARGRPARAALRAPPADAPRPPRRSAAPGSARPASSAASRSSASSRRKPPSELLRVGERAVGRQRRPVPLPQGGRARRRLQLPPAEDARLLDERLVLGPDRPLLLVRQPPGLLRRSSRVDQQRVSHRFPPSDRTVTPTTNGRGGKGHGGGDPSRRPERGKRRLPGARRRSGSFADGMRIEIWSDVVCPWCYIGKRRFETALAAFERARRGRGRLAQLRARPRRAADAAEPPAERLAQKYGMTVEQAEEAQARVTGVAAAEGLDYRLADARSGNSFDAHRLLHLAGERGLQPELKERLLRALLHRGRGDRRARASSSGSPSRSGSTGAEVAGAARRRPLRRRGARRRAPRAPARDPRRAVLRHRRAPTGSRARSRPR